MDDLLLALPRQDRDLVRRMADQADVSPGAILPEIVSAYLRLLREVPQALPRDALRRLSVAAEKRAGVSK